MTQKITHWHSESIYINQLSPACQLCSEGAKLVLLITGLCPASCYYCPLSMKKGGKDRIFADEWELKNEEDIETILTEADLIDAKGAGITGGDPLSVPRRTIDYITQLKNTFGDLFHIHLYTSGLEHHQCIKDLASAGLDEIRFHPMPQAWNTMDTSPLASVISDALKTDMDVAIEIPVIPQMNKEITALITWADQQGLNWVNLNELEFSERNENALRTKGFHEKNDISAAVQQSQETATKIIESFTSSDVNIGVHFCSASFKDGIQLKNRMLRRAHKIATPFDVITEDATILKGIIQAKNPAHLETIHTYIIEAYTLTKQDYRIDTKELQIHLPIPLLEEIAQDLKHLEATCYISEQYPTHDQLEVERIPLPLNNQ